MVFETEDPRGVRVVCTEDCWNHHVVIGHITMVGCENEVKQAIERPYMNMIFADRVKEDRLVYYAKVKRGRMLYLKVIVRFLPGDAGGEVVTAYRVSNRPRGEKWIWPTSSRS